MPDKYWTCAVYLALTIITLVVFWQVRTFEFTTCDDDRYVTENTHVTTGLTVDNVIWAFTSTHFFMWHPITTLSNMLDCRLFGLNAGRHHLINLILHIANALLLFGILKAMTVRIWPSAFVAAVFAMHPLNVESVAWVAERKNVLSTFFLLLTIAAYIRYAERPRLSNYLLVICVFSLALMSKPTTVTLPFVLLLLDYWPLNRAQICPADKIKWRIWAPLIWEKVPFFILSTALCIITIIAQKSGDVLKLNEYLPFTVRLANALVAYISYIGKMIYPSHLSIFYPHPGFNLPLWKSIVSFVLLVAVSIGTLYLGRRRPYLMVGWFWYLGTLVPVIGLMQAGSQAMADRYAYVPLVGLFIIIAWGISDLLAGWKYRRIVLSLSSLAIISVLSVCTWFQTAYWHDSVNLLEHNLKVIGYNIPKSHYHLAKALSQKGKINDSVAHLKEAIRLDENWADSLNDLAWFLAVRKGTEFYNPPKAVQLARRACELTAYENAGILDTLAVAYAAENRFPDAVEIAEKALKMAQSAGEKQLIDQIQRRLDLFKANQPYIEMNP